MLNINKKQIKSLLILISLSFAVILVSLGLTFLSRSLQKNSSINNQKVSSKISSNSVPTSTSPTSEIKKDFEKLEIGRISKKITDRSAVLEWETNIPAETVLYYGDSEQRDNLEMIKFEKNVLARHHSYEIENLEPDTKYYYYVPSRDIHKNPMRNISSEFTTKSKDSDQDGLSDEIEKKIGTDINIPDTDEDGYSDGSEYRNSTDPLNENDNIETVEISENEIFIDWFDEVESESMKKFENPNEYKTNFSGVSEEIITKIGNVAKGKYKDSLLYKLTYRETYYGLFIYINKDKNIFLSNYSKETNFGHTALEEKNIKEDKQIIIKNLGLPNKINLPESKTPLLLDTSSISSLKASANYNSKLVYSKKDLSVYRRLDSGCFLVDSRSSENGYYFLNINKAFSLQGSNPKIPKIKWNNSKINSEYYVSRPISRFEWCYSYLSSFYHKLEFLKNVSDSDLKIIGQIENEPVYTLKNKDNLEKFYNTILPRGFYAQVYEKNNQDPLKTNTPIRDVIGNFTEEQKNFIINENPSEDHFFDFNSDQIDKLEKENYIFLWKDPFGDFMIFHKPIFESNLKSE